MSTGLGPLLEMHCLSQQGVLQACQLGLRRLAAL